MATLIFSFGTQAYEVRYDQYGDVLYVISASSRDASHIRSDDADIQWRYMNKDAFASGFTVMDFVYGWHNRSSDLKNRIYQNMRRDDKFVEVLMTAIYDASREGSKDVPQALERLGVRF